MKTFILSAAAVLFSAAFCFASQPTFFTDGPAGVKKIALTFDDGPGRNTQIFLDILDEKNVKATFFMLGEQAQARPALARKVRDGGHEIANHLYAHTNYFSFQGDDKAAHYKDNLLRGEAAIYGATGVKTNLVRSPYGYSRDAARRAAAENGYVMVNWTFGIDWDRNLTAEQMYARYKAAIRPGAILLMHDASANPRVPSFLAALIDDIHAQGLEIVTVSELLNLKQGK